MGIGVVDKGFGVVLAVVVAGSARKVADLCGEVVDSNMEGVDLHIAGLLNNGLGTSGPVRVEDGVNQSGLSNGNIQGLRLAKHNLLAGFFFEAFFVPVQGGSIVKGGNSTAKAAEFVGVGGDCTLALS